MSIQENNQKVKVFLPEMRGYAFCYFPVDPSSCLTLYITKRSCYSSEIEKNEIMLELCIHQNEKASTNFIFEV